MNKKAVLTWQVIVPAILGLLVIALVATGVIRPAYNYVSEKVFGIVSPPSEEEFVPYQITSGGVVVDSVNAFTCAVGLVESKKVDYEKYCQNDYFLSAARLYPGQYGYGEITSEEEVPTPKITGAALAGQEEKCEGKLYGKVCVECNSNVANRERVSLPKDKQEAIKNLVSLTLDCWLKFKANGDRNVHCSEISLRNLSAAISKSEFMSALKNSGDIGKGLAGVGLTERNNIGWKFDLIQPNAANFFLCVDSSPTPDTLYFTTDLKDCPVVYTAEGNQLMCTVKNFELPQEIDKSLLSTYVKGIGDPEFLFYYERFPDGEDIYWSMDMFSWGVPVIIMSGVANAIMGPGGGLGKEVAKEIGESSVKTLSKAGMKRALAMTASKSFLTRGIAALGKKFWGNTAEQVVAKKMAGDLLVESAGQFVKPHNVDDALGEIAGVLSKKGTLTNTQAVAIGLKRFARKNPLDFATGPISQELKKVSSSLGDEYVVDVYTLYKTGLGAKLDRDQMVSFIAGRLSKDAKWQAKSTVEAFEGGVALDFRKIAENSVDAIQKNIDDFADTMGLQLVKNFGNDITAEQIKMSMRKEAVEAAVDQVAKSGKVDDIIEQVAALEAQKPGILRRAVTRTAETMSTIGESRIYRWGALAPIAGATKVGEVGYKLVSHIPVVGIPVRVSAGMLKALRDPKGKAAAILALGIFGQYQESLNEKWLPMGQNALFLNTPNVMPGSEAALDFAETLPREENDCCCDQKGIYTETNKDLCSQRNGMCTEWRNCKIAYLQLEKQDQPSTRFHLVSPCKADLRIFKSSASCLLKKDINFYDLIDFGDGLIGVRADSLQYLIEEDDFTVMPRLKEKISRDLEFDKWYLGNELNAPNKDWYYKVSSSFLYTMPSNNEYTKKYIWKYIEERSVWIYSAWTPEHADFIMSKVYSLGINKWLNWKDVGGEIDWEYAIGYDGYRYALYAKKGTNYQAYYGIGKWSRLEPTEWATVEAGFAAAKITGKVTGFVTFEPQPNTEYFYRDCESDADCPSDEGPCVLMSKLCQEPKREYVGCFDDASCQINNLGKCIMTPRPGGIPSQTCEIPKGLFEKPKPPITSPAEREEVPVFVKTPGLVNQHLQMIERNWAFPHRVSDRITVTEAPLNEQEQAQYNKLDETGRSAFMAEKTKALENKIKVKYESTIISLKKRMDDNDAKYQSCMNSETEAVKACKEEELAGDCMRNIMEKTCQQPAEEYFKIILDIVNFADRKTVPENWTFPYGYYLQDAVDILALAEDRYIDIGVYLFYDLDEAYTSMLAARDSCFKAIAQKENPAICTIYKDMFDDLIGVDNFNLMAETKKSANYDTAVKTAEKNIAIQRYFLKKYLTEECGQAEFEKALRENKIQELIDKYIWLIIERYAINLTKEKTQDAAEKLIEEAKRRPAVYNEIVSVLKDKGYIVYTEWPEDFILSKWGYTHLMQYLPRHWEYFGMAGQLLSYAEEIAAVDSIIALGLDKADMNAMLEEAVMGKGLNLKIQCLRDKNYSACYEALNMLHEVNYVNRDYYELYGHDEITASLLDLADESMIEIFISAETMSELFKILQRYSPGDPGAFNVPKGAVGTHYAYPPGVESYETAKEQCPPSSILTSSKIGDCLTTSLFYTKFFDAYPKAVRDKVGAMSMRRIKSYANIIEIGDSAFETLKAEVWGLELEPRKPADYLNLWNPFEIAAFLQYRMETCQQAANVMMNIPVFYKHFGFDKIGEKDRTVFGKVYHYGKWFFGGNIIALEALGVVSEESIGKYIPTEYTKSLVDTVYWQDCVGGFNGLYPAFFDKKLVPNYGGLKPAFVTPPAYDKYVVPEFRRMEADPNYDDDTYTDLLLKKRYLELKENALSSNRDSVTIAHIFISSYEAFNKYDFKKWLQISKLIVEKFSSNIDKSKAVEVCYHPSEVTGVEKTVKSVVEASAFWDQATVSITPRTIHIQPNKLETEGANYCYSVPVPDWNTAAKVGVYISTIFLDPLVGAAAEYFTGGCFGITVAAPALAPCARVALLIKGMAEAAVLHALDTSHAWPGESFFRKAGM